MPTRRFPPPWTVEEQPACFVVCDHNGRVQEDGVPLAVVLNYSHGEPWSHCSTEEADPECVA